MIVVVNGQECFSTRQEAADFLGCSYQTIFRYTDHRQQASRRIELIRDGWKQYIPLSELIRFRDEIRPTFKYGGKYGRPKGAKDKKPRQVQTKSDWWLYGG